VIDNENPHNALTQGHLGIQVKSTRSIKETCACLLKAGFKILTENGAECSCAVQTKVCAADPDGNHWEVVCTTIPDAIHGCGCGEVCICHQEFERNYV
jgi:predicted lactoylglutathione lyase